MVNDRVTQVGCGMSTYKSFSGGWNYTNYLMACNIDSNNVDGWTTYKVGEPASACVDGADVDFPGLCKVTEPIDPNSKNN